MISCRVILQDVRDGKDDRIGVDCKTVGFFLKISKEIGKAWRKSLKRAKRVRRQKKTFSPQSHSPFSASFQTFCLTARAYLNTQKYGLFCSLESEFSLALLFCVWF